ncbi:unnamed protein product [Lampetra planeri]
MKPAGQLGYPMAKEPSRLLKLQKEFQERLLREKEATLIAMQGAQYQTAFFSENQRYVKMQRMPSGWKYPHTFPRMPSNTRPPLQFLPQPPPQPPPSYLRQTQFGMQKRSAGIDRAKPLPQIKKKSSSLHNIFQTPQPAFPHYKAGDTLKVTDRYPSGPLKLPPVDVDKSKQPSNWTTQSQCQNDVAHISNIGKAKYIETTPSVDANSGATNTSDNLPLLPQSYQQQVIESHQAHAPLERSNLTTPHWMVQKQKDDEESIEEEIQRKEREILAKLNKFQEELQIIQRERQMAEEEERHLEPAIQGITETHFMDRHKVIPAITRTGDSKKLPSLHGNQHDNKNQPGMEEDQFENKTSKETHHEEESNTPHSVVTSNKSKNMTNHKSGNVEDDVISIIDETQDYEYQQNFTDETDYLADQETLDLAKCHTCGRTFAKDRLEKHAKICTKTTQKKRKVFDFSKIRVEGTDMEKFCKKKSKTPEQAKKPNWRAKSEALQRTLREARIAQHGGKLSDLPPPAPAENPDYVSCPHCQRRFAPDVAERHVPKCQNLRSRPAPPKRK